jgi:hypothetical protein
MSPNLQAHVESVIPTIKHEVLNAFCEEVWGQANSNFFAES